MPSYSERSKFILDTCHPDLQKLMNEVIKHVDCSILEGHRDEERQKRLYKNGRSKVIYPNSKHNSYPSMAVDAIPYPIDWADVERMYMFVGFVRGIAKSLNINICVGADWDGDFTFKDQTFNDLPHIQLKT